MSTVVNARGHFISYQLLTVRRVEHKELDAQNPFVIHGFQHFFQRHLGLLQNTWRNAFGWNRGLVQNAIDVLVATRRIEKC